MTLSLKPLLPLIGIATATLAGSVLPHDKIYGVNLGEMDPFNFITCL